MQTLDQQQRELAARLRAGRADPDTRVVIIADSIHRWASLQLASVCPLTSALLAHLGRWDDVVAAALHDGTRRPDLHEWGISFLCALAEDPDPLVVTVTVLERIILGDPAARWPAQWGSYADRLDLLTALLSGELPVIAPDGPAAHG